jgi:hypothetical protein
VDGFITIWNWVSGQKLVSLPLKSTIRGLQVVVSEDFDNEQLLLLLENSNEASKQWTISFFEVLSHKEAFVPDLISLQSTSEPLQFLSVVCGRRFIFAASNTCVLVGVQSAHSTSRGSEDSEDGRLYKWSTFDFKAEVSSFDVRVDKQYKSKNKEKVADQPDICRLAIGSKLGSIFVYEDIINSLQQPGQLNRFELHWHRETVLSVKWSADGT